jgi:hypothetical protein
VSVVLFGSYSVFLHCFRFCWLDFSFPLRGSVLPQVHSVPIGFSEASRRSFFPCCFSTHFLLARRQGFVAVPDFFFVRSTVAWGHFQQIGTSRSIAWYRLGFLPRNRSRVRFCFCPQLLSPGRYPKSGLWLSPFSAGRWCCQLRSFESHSVFILVCSMCSKHWSFR